MSDVPDGTYRAVVDRIEGGLVALELTAENERVGPSANGERRSRTWELLVPPDELPVAARQADAVLTVTVADGSLSSASHDPDATESRAETARERFDRLSERPPNADDGSSADESSDEPDGSDENSSAT